MILFSLSHVITTNFLVHLDKCKRKPAISSNHVYISLVAKKHTYSVYIYNIFFSSLENRVHAFFVYEEQHKPIEGVHSKERDGKA